MTEKDLVKKYEELANRIFLFDNSTCPYGSTEDDLKHRQLVYVFMTKSDNKSGQLGFLHPSFYDYFHARYIVSQIKSGKKEQIETLFQSLRARPIKDLDRWDLVKQVVGLRDDEDMQVNRVHIETVLDLLNKKEMVASLLCGEDYEEGSDGEKDSIQATEKAIFNLLGACAAIENGCLTGSDEARKNHGYPDKHSRIPFTDYPQVCTMLRRGGYDGIYLQGVNMEQCDLGEARMREAHLKGTILRGAKLEGTHLEGAHLEGAILDQAILKNAHLDRAFFKRTGFEGTQLSGASLAEAVLKDTDLKKATFVEEEQQNMLSACTVRLEKATLEDVHLEGCHLKGVNLQRAVLRNTYLDDAKMEGANLKGAVLFNVHLERACDGADWRERI